MPPTQGYSYPRPQEEGDGRDRGIMGLSVGIKDDVYLHATLVGAYERPSQLH